MERLTLATSAMDKPKGAASEPAREEDGLCSTLCDRSAKLKCGPPDACIDGCRQMLALEACSGEMRGFLICLTREPIGHFECDDQGVAAIKDGYCNAEQQRVANCFTRSAKRE